MNVRLLIAFTLVTPILGLTSGCKKSQRVEIIAPATNQPAPAATATAPAPTPPPGGGAPAPVAGDPPMAIDTSSIDATLADLTRSLRRTMIGRRLSGSFDEFVAISKVTPPPPPPGKKYAISKQWKVILVDQ